MIKNRNGFTIAEITVGLAMGALLVLAFANVMSYISIYNRKAYMMSEGRIASSLGERFMWMHFKNAEPSFNNLTQGAEFLDDNGKPFYMLNPNAVTSSMAVADKTRSVLLTWAGRRTFTVAAVNTSDKDIVNGYSPSFFVDPTKFYNIQPNMNAGLNLGPTVDMGLFTAYIRGQNPVILNADNKFVQVFSPITVRNVNAAITTPPNPVSYFLRYSNGTFVDENFGGAVKNVNASDTTLNLTKFDDFLKTLPSSGGGIPPLMARGVRYIQYSLFQRVEPGHPEPVTCLQYATWNGSAFVNPVFIADRIQSITIGRQDISDPLITAKIVMARLQELRR
jgi:hypothetical protein